MEENSNSREIKVELTEDACKDTLRKIVEEIPEIQLAGSEAIEVAYADNSFEVSLHLKIKKWLSIPEEAEKIQKKIAEGFLLNTGFELKKIDLTFEAFFEE